MSYSLKHAPIASSRVGPESPLNFLANTTSSSVSRPSRMLSVLLLLPVPLPLLLLLAWLLLAGLLENFLVPFFSPASTGLATGLEVSSKNDLRKWKEGGHQKIIRSRQEQGFKSSGSPVTSRTSPAFSLRHLGFCGLALCEKRALAKISARRGRECPCVHRAPVRL